MIVKKAREAAVKEVAKATRHPFTAAEIANRLDNQLSSCEVARVLKGLDWPKAGREPGPMQYAPGSEWRP